MQALTQRLPIYVCVLVCSSSMGLWFWQGKKEEDSIVEAQGNEDGCGGETGQRRGGEDDVFQPVKP